MLNQRTCTVAGFAAMFVLSSCGGGTEGAATSDAPPVSGIDRAVATSTAAQPDFVEVSFPTILTLDLPGPSPVGATLLIPLRVTTSDDEWLQSELVLDVSGDAAAEHDVELSELSVDEPATGILRIAIEPGTADQLNEVDVAITGRSLDGRQSAEVDGVLLALLADESTVYLGYGGHGMLRRERLVSLLEAGDISQSEYDDAYTETYAPSTPTGTVTVKP